MSERITERALGEKRGYLESAKSLLGEVEKETTPTQYELIESLLLGALQLLDYIEAERKCLVELNKKFDKVRASHARVDGRNAELELGIRALADELLCGAMKPTPREVENDKIGLKVLSILGDEDEWENTSLLTIKKRFWSEGGDTLGDDE